MTEQTVACELRLPQMAHFYDQIKANAQVAQRMVTFRSRVGKRVAVCGAGPSLRVLRDKDTRAALVEWADEVWAANSALPTLWDWGFKPTHGVSIDQNLAMLDDTDFGRLLPVHYYLASSAHPKLVRTLLKANRRVSFFHSFLGIPDPPEWNRRHHGGKTYEMYLYTSARIFPDSVQVGHGLNSAVRAVCLGIAQGFAHVRVYGADCAMAPDGPPMPQRVDDTAYRAWMEKLVMYANGRTPAVFGAPPMAEAMIDGRRWHTRPDMVISAQHLLQLEQAYPGRIHLIGDTLPNAIRDKDEAWLKRLPQLNQAGQVSNFGRPKEHVA